MPWAPWHTAVQVISQRWLCPLLQSEMLLEKQVSSLRECCFALYRCSEYLSCGTTQEIGILFFRCSILGCSLELDIIAHTDVMRTMTATSQHMISGRIVINPRCILTHYISPCCILTHYIFITGRLYYYLHFTEREAEVHRS